MGAVKKFLAERPLKDREKHNSRLFVDLCENIHIHFREYRLIFSLDEYFEFVDIVEKSTRDVRNYLYNNPEYIEEQYPTTIMVACGKDRQRKFLKHSPAPHVSAYHNNKLAIELQEEHITDEIHVHWRDLRIALNRENFKDIAAAFTEAHQTLLEFEKQHDYQRKGHLDRDIDGFNNSDLNGESVLGTVKLSLEKIASYWFNDLKTEWNHNKEYISELQSRFRSGVPVTPIVVSKPNKDGVHHIVNGHHRVLAAQEVGAAEIEAIVLPMSFEETELLRKAESLIKEFDKKTGYEYGLTPFLNDYIAHKFNRFYRNDFQERIRQIHRSPVRKIIGKIERLAKKIKKKLGLLRTGGSPAKSATSPAPRSKAA